MQTNKWRGFVECSILSITMTSRLGPSPTPPEGSGNDSHRIDCIWKRPQLAQGLVWVMSDSCPGSIGPPPQTFQDA